jgi:hypothetical protein
VLCFTVCAELNAGPFTPLALLIKGCVARLIPQHPKVPAHYQSLLLFCFQLQKRRLLSPFPGALTHSAFCKSFSCHCYENTGSACRRASTFDLQLPTVNRLIPLESADPQNTRVTPLQSADPKTKDLKSFAIRTYSKGGGWQANC